MTLVPYELNSPVPGQVLLIGRDPGEDEVEAGRPFVGRAGQLLDEVLSETGLRRQDVNIANVSRLRPENNDFSVHDPGVLEQEIAFLQATVASLRPSLIITLGNEAAYALIPGWPTRGREIYGAKNIMERRGYFWNTPSGWVLSTIHPAAVLRKEVPGRWLLKTDFLRARKWLAGALPQEQPPEIKPLRSMIQAYSLTQSRLVAWDIETKWDMTAQLMSGFCGDDLQPMVALYPRDWRYAEFVLRSPVPKVGHNGHGFDLPAMRWFHNLRVQGYTDDTQQMWHALEPELAGSDETSGEEVFDREAQHRMTRKGLAFVASILFNVQWWKIYPSNEDPEHVSKMFTLNGIDAWVTRRAASVLLERIKKEQVEEQYQLAMRMYPTLVELQLRGLPVDNALRLTRQAQLEARASAAKEKAGEAALAYIVKHDVPEFRTMKKCECCGGGKTQRERCIRCSQYFTCGIPEKITKAHALGFQYKTLKEFKASFPKCETCSGAGKIKTYEYNAYCLAPETRVLTTELRWVSVGSLHAGDHLIGFDEYPPGDRGCRRRLRDAAVLGIQVAFLPAYRIVTDKGTVVASADHAWLSRYRTAARDQWVRTKDLRSGHKIQFLAAPWEPDFSYEAGRIRSNVECEGFLTQGHGRNPILGAFTQKNGTVLQNAVELLKQKKFSVAVDPKADGRVVDVYTVYIRGGKGELLRFLGTFRPDRLLWHKVWEGRATGNAGSKRAAVLSIEYIGKMELIGVTTSTKTLIVEGLLSHNSEHQMKKLLYNVLSAPKHTWQGKTTSDATALKKVLRWARAQ